MSSKFAGASYFYGMIRKGLLWLFGLFWPLVSCLAAAPSDSLVKAGITQISLTRQGQILAADDQSNIFLFDSLGKQLYSFSPRRPARIHLLEGWNNLRLFVFYRDFQEYLLLDRFLIADETTGLPQPPNSYCRLAAPAQDGNIWMLDESAFQLKKVQLRSGNVLFSSPLDLVLRPGKYQLNFMREYQNQVFVCDAKGPVLQFDQMGNFKKKLPLQGLTWLGFWGEELYGIQADTVVLFHPFLLRVRKWPLPEICRGARQLLIAGQQVFWINEKGLFRARIIPPPPDR